MKTLLDKWKPTKRFGKIIKRVLNVALSILFLAFIVMPFLRLDGGWKEAFKWMWIGIAILHLDQFAGYKKARKERIIYPMFSAFLLLLSVYLANYWSLIPFSAGIVVPLVVGTLEVAISIYAYKAIRFTPNQELKIQPAKVTTAILIGSVYASAVSLFILGHFLGKTMIFVFGIITMIMLFSSVISVISKGFSSNKSIVSTTGIILDIISVLALIGYLIYLTPKENSLQDIVLSLTSAVIGGALTLAGVAWTIKKTDNDRKEDERKKAKPLFAFSRKADDNDNIMEKKACFETGLDKRKFEVCVDIENSDRAPFVISRIFTDGKWRAIEGDTVVLPNKTVILQFYFEDDVHNIFMEVKDALNNCYYYEMKVLCVKSFIRSIPSPRLHTIREIKEISPYEIEKRTKTEGFK